MVSKLYKATAQWSFHKFSGYQSVSGSRYDGWTGHDIMFNWNDAFGLSWMELTGGIMNIAIRARRFLIRTKRFSIWIPFWLARFFCLANLRFRS